MHLISIPFPWTMESRGLFRKLLRARRYSDAEELARSPDMRGLGEVYKLIKRSSLYAEHIRARRIGMPTAGSAIRAEGAVQYMAAVGGSAPYPGCPSGDSKTGFRNEKRDAKFRSRLLAALPAMTNVDLEGPFGTLVSQVAALTSAFAHR